VDEVSKEYYDSLGKFESGRSKGKLTRTDSLAWKDKSWVVGVQINDEAKAYDWIGLKEARIVNDVVGGKPIVVAVASDNQSFVAFERFTDADTFTIRNDTLFTADRSYNFSGRDLGTLSGRLKSINAYQEFWHSWRTFHPNTKQ